MRILFMELAQRWVSREWLNNAEDIFFLTISEIDEIITYGDPSIHSKDLHSIVADRRAAFDYWQHVVPPVAIGPNGSPLSIQATDPGWTTVFPLVCGIVLEIGGQLSHGAIIAREYAIPAVINVQGAMQRIRDGQKILVDGTSGRVYLDEEAFA